MFALPPEASVGHSRPCTKSWLMITHFYGKGVGEVPQRALPRGQVWLKLEAELPTGSFKVRVSR